MSDKPVRHVYDSDNCLYCAGTLIFCRIMDKNGVWHYRVGCEDCKAINPKSITSTLRSLCQVPALHTLPHFLTKVQRSEDAGTGASIPLHRPPYVLKQAYSAMSKEQLHDVYEFQRRMSCSLLHAVDAILGWGSTKLPSSWQVSDCNTEPEPEEPAKQEWVQGLQMLDRLEAALEALLPLMSKLGPVETGSQPLTMTLNPEPNELAREEVDGLRGECDMHEKAGTLVPMYPPFLRRVLNLIETAGLVQERITPDGE